MNMLRACVAIISCLYSKNGSGKFIEQAFYVMCICRHCQAYINILLDMTNISCYCLLKRWAPGCKYLRLSNDSLQLYGHKTYISGANTSMTQ